MTDNEPLVIEVSPELRHRIEELARKYGFETPGEYLLSLIEPEIQDEDTHDHEDILESFRQGWREAMSGQTIPASELMDALRDDE
jgi:hypothetical protein